MPTVDGKRFFTNPWRAPCGCMHERYEQCPPIDTDVSMEPGMLFVGLELSDEEQAALEIDCDRREELRRLPTDD